MEPTKVRVEEIAGGFAAYSQEWGIAASGPTRREAAERLGALILLFSHLADRVAASLSRDP